MAWQGRAGRGLARRGKARIINQKGRKMEQEGKTYFGGIPTDIDIKKLNDNYPADALKAGDVIFYSEIEDLLKINRNDHRFKTVTTRWRSILERETGMRIGAYAGDTFKVMSESEKLVAVENKKRSVVRQVRKNRARTTMINPKELTEDERRRLEHESITANNILAIQQLRNKQLTLPTI
jgi:hypothetical protein